MTSARSLAVLIHIGLTGAALGAPPASPGDGKAVAQCIDAARKSGGFAGHCISIVADPCIKAASKRDSAVQDAKACAARELAVWAARLAASIKSVGKNGGSAMLAAVTAAQKDWAGSLDRLCPLFDNLDPGMALGGEDYCRLQETARRVLLLERLGEAVSEH